MSSGVYLAVMLGVIGIMTIIIVPTMFTQKCGACGARNGLDAKVCRRCKEPFPDDPVGE